MQYNYPRDLKTKLTWADIFVCAVLQVSDALQAHKVTPTPSE